MRQLRALRRQEVLYRKVVTTSEWQAKKARIPEGGTYLPGMAGSGSRSPLVEVRYESR